jgi:hypothetical protein
VAEIDFTGVTSIDFTVRVSKVGTGTQDWQLYDMTGAAQIGVVSDAGAAGDRTLTTNISSGIPSGIALVRVRGQSSTTNDDPIYLGSSIKLNY